MPAVLNSQDAWLLRAGALIQNGWEWDYETKTNHRKEKSTKRQSLLSILYFWPMGTPVMTPLTGGLHDSSAHVVSL